jgi:hypothetical protein
MNMLTVGIISWLVIVLGIGIFFSFKKVNDNE